MHNTADISKTMTYDFAMPFSVAEKKVTLILMTATSSECRICRPNSRNWRRLCLKRKGMLTEVCSDFDMFLELRDQHLEDKFGTPQIQLRH